MSLNIIVKHSKRVCLVGAVGVSVFVQSAVAQSPSVEMESDQAEVQQESLLIDDSLIVRLRYQDWNSGSGGSKVDAQAIDAKYESGYYKGFIGFDVGAAYAADLFGGTINGQESGNLPKGQNYFGSMTAAYIKAKYDPFGLKGGYGLKSRSYNTVSDQGSRIIGSSTQGADVSWTRDSVNIYAGQITASSQRDSSSVDDLTTRDGKQIDNINIIGASYTVDDFTFEGEYSVSKDTVARSFAKVAYSKALNDDLAVGGDVRYNVLDPKSRYDSLVTGDVSQYAKVNTDTSEHINLNVNTTYKKVTANLAYTTVSGNDFNYYSFANDYGQLNSSTYNWDAFGYEGEQSVGLSIDIDATFITPGLYFGGVYTKNISDADAYNNFNQKDFTYWAGYDFGKLDDALEGLTVAYVGASYKTRGTPKDSDNYINATQTLYDESPNRIRVEYVKAIF